MSDPELPRIRTGIPGPRSRDLARRLEAAECREVTALAPGPVFWESGRGPCVSDVDGNRFVDLLAGFGASCLGYGHEGLARAVAEQAARLQHALGDVQPALRKLELLEALAATLPGDLGHAILSGSGSDAVESALKTALVATGRPGVLAFTGGYHGLGFGALDATWRAGFRAPFRTRLPGLTRWAPYGNLAAARRIARAGDPPGAILFEPIQGRGGIVVPPAGFVAGLRALADELGALLIADEVYTGLGRTGAVLACEHEDVLPDVVAVGKALGGGLPLSACAGSREVMSAWPASQGEAIHTSTHLGNPVTCAAGCVVLEALADGDLVRRSATLGARWQAELAAALASSDDVVEVRGRGLLIGIQLRDGARAERATAELLAAGWITLPEGPQADVLALTPPLNVSEAVLEAATRALAGVLA